MEETDKTWQKMEREIQTVGLGDGLSSGKNSSFQSHFDEGFFEGFNSAYSIGRFKGAVLARNVQQNTPLEENDLLKHPKLAWCQACRNQNLLKGKISGFTEHQRSYCNKNLHELNSLYPSIF